MTTAQTARQPISAALETRLKVLQTQGQMTVYLGEITGTLPLGAGGRVAPYAVIYPTPGQPDLNPSLSATPTDFLWTAQVTFSAGYLNDLLAAMDEAIPHLRGWAPAINGLDCDGFRPQPSFNARPISRDDDIRPTRFWVPTMWQLHVVTRPSA